MEDKKEEVTTAPVLEAETEKKADVSEELIEDHKEGEETIKVDQVD